MLSIFIENVSHVLEFVDELITLYHHLLHILCEEPIVIPDIFCLPKVLYQMINLKIERISWWLRKIYHVQSGLIEKLIYEITGHSLATKHVLFIQTCTQNFYTHHIITEIFLCRKLTSPPKSLFTQVSLPLQQS